VFVKGTDKIPENSPPISIDDFHLFAIKNVPGTIFPEANSENSQLIPLTYSIYMLYFTTAELYKAVKVRNTMFFERKTKSQSIVKAILIPVLAIICFFGLMVTVGPGPAFYALGSIYLLVSVMPIITYLRTRSEGYLAVAIFTLFAGLVCISAPPAIKDKSNPGLTPVFLVLMYISMMVTFYMTFNRKLRWRGEEVFELAALPIEDIGDSFTARPRPAGQVAVSKTEMIRFVDFVTRNLIAFPFKEENRVVFVLTLPNRNFPYVLGIKKNYLEDTWAAVDYDGNITVNITEEDYLLFKKDLDFDQICQSLGDVFSEFLELSKNGQESQIIDRMNALRLNPFG
jgi:hypothetical protein